jgi:TonB family protein
MPRVALLLALVASSAPGFADEPPAPTLSAPPKLLHFVEAEAPPALATRGSADVILAIDVDEAGHVGQVTVIAPAGDGFDEAAVAAAKQFTFAPGESEGKPVPVRITYRYRFVQKVAPPPAPPDSPTSVETPAAPTIQGVPFAGVVKRRGDRVGLSGILVIVDESLATATTDPDGAFAFDAIPVGEHTVHLRGAIAAADLKITLNAGKRTDVTYFVAAVERYSTTVRANRVTQETVEQTLQAEEFKKIPGTQGDVLKAVQNLPGVARAPFGLGVLIVWGSAPEDTRAYVDGLYIPTLYHFGGLRSTVNGEVIQSMTFLPGGYGADFGRGLGGVVDVASRRPRTDGYHGFVQLDLIDGSLMLEGPITKNLSFAIGARRSWIDVFLPLFTSNSFQLSPRYWDYQALLHWRATSRDDVDVFFFGSVDDLSLIANNPDPQLSRSIEGHTFYHRALARWTHRWGNGATLSIAPSLGYDAPNSTTVAFGGNDFTLDAAVVEYNLRATLHVPLSSWLRVDAGLDYEGTHYERTLSGAGVGTGGNPNNPASGLGFAVGGRPGGNDSEDFVVYGNHVAPYVGLAFLFFDKRLTITPQLRLDLLSMTGARNTPNEFSTNNLELEPRLAVRFQLLPWLALKGSAGVYHQPPQPGQLSTLTGNPNLTPETGFTYVFGADVEATKTLHIEAQGFYKDLRQLIVNGEHFGDPQLENDGIGRVYGGELLVRQELWHNLFGWISYTLSRSERKDHPDQDWHLFQFDQTHIFQILASYKLPRGYQVGLRFRYITGNLYTPVVGAFYDSNTNNYTRLSGPLNSARLDGFNQLDLRFDKTWTFNYWKLSVYIDIQNLYNAHNPELMTYSFNFRQSQPVSGLPFFPVLGIRGEF